MKSKEPEIIGQCSICLRDMIDGYSVDRHHLIPILKGKKSGPTIKIHRICHEKIHSIWTENEIAKKYNSPELIRASEEMKEFLEWIQKQKIDLYSPTKMSNKKRR